ncbi:MAG: fluoride efflux transporter CrcB [Firmicutes bacterium HGW-Firmicutes-1]|jgi:CrcB protein|nr:MAG: fluoride efflux transporter CrcB [Firmicutes bacterium HGW-Firmicutes-1]
MQYVFICIGGALGSVSRYALGKMISEKTNTTFPIGTFIINIMGAFLLGIVSNQRLTQNVTLMLTDGFLGGFTTFSTFMYEGFNLFQENEKLNAFTYIGGSLILGIIGYVFGVKFSQ